MTAPVTWPWRVARLGVHCALVAPLPSHTPSHLPPPTLVVATQGRPQGCSPVPNSLHGLTHRSQVPPLQVLLLTDDADNRRKAAELGIQAVSTLVSAFAGGDGWWGWLGSAL